MNEQAQREMPKYRSHKEVWALKIREIQAATTGAILVFEDEGYGPRQVSADYLLRHQPRAGGYFVVYKDGYQSWSPAEAFEEGYALLPGNKQMRYPIDPKYGMEIHYGVPILVKMETGEPIPPNEPLILFRARDRNALPGALMPYHERCLEDGCNEFHMDGINNRIAAFRAFERDHEDRMKQPGITRGL